MQNGNTVTKSHNSHITYVSIFTTGDLVIWLILSMVWGHTQTVSCNLYSWGIIMQNHYTEINACIEIFLITCIYIIKLEKTWEEKLT